MIHSFGIQLLLTYDGINCKTLHSMLVLSMEVHNGIASPFEEDLHSSAHKVDNWQHLLAIRNLLEGSKNTTVATQQQVRSLYTSFVSLKSMELARFYCLRKEKVEIEINSVWNNLIVQKKDYVISG